MWYAADGIAGRSCDFPGLRKRFWGAASSCGRVREEDTLGHTDAPGAGHSVAAKGSMASNGKGRNGPASLDLGAVLNADHPPTELQLRREKFAYFEKRCSKVAEGIFLGSDTVARSRDCLRNAGVTHVLNCVGFISPEYFADELEYKTLWLQDTPAEDITSVLYDAFNFIERVLEAGGSVYVHCSQGVSRSATLVIAYLMWRDGRGYDAVYQRVRAVRGVANPNMGFACQLLQWHKRLMSPAEVVRVYRMAPHSEHDPRFLVPKKVEGPSVACLDVRGAFVVHTPDSLWIWVGPECCEAFVGAAVAAAGGLAKYEGAPSPAVQVVAGQEPPALRRALGADDHGAWQPFKTRVEEYTRDFMVFFGEGAEKKIDRHGSLGHPGGAPVPPRPVAEERGSAGGQKSGHKGSGGDGSGRDDDDEEDDDYWLMEA